jgi:FkbM family methyltransferase
VLKAPVASLFLGRIDGPMTGLLFHLRRSRLLRPLWHVPITIPVRWNESPFTVYADLFRNMSFVINRGWVGEFEERSSFVKLIKHFNANVFWDVGANLGTYSLIFLQNNPGGAVLAFEPDRRNLTLLRKTAQYNSLSSLKIVPFAVGDKVGEATFFIDDITGATGSLVTSHFIAEQFGQDPLQSLVQTTTLDEQLNGERCPDLIKIDVEGADLAVLRGATRVLEACRPIVMFEASLKNFSESRKMLEDLQYRLLDPATLRGLHDGETPYNVIALHRCMNL